MNTDVSLFLSAQATAWSPDGCQLPGGHPTPTGCGLSSSYGGATDCGD